MKQFDTNKFEKRYLHVKQQRRFQFSKSLEGSFIIETHRNMATSEEESAVGTNENEDKEEEKVTFKSLVSNLVPK